MSKEDQRREYNEQKELENLRRVFEAIDKNRDSKLDAKELNAVLGPKGSAAAADLIIDLHNTTANTGVALMMAPTDELSHAIAAHLIALDPSVRVCNWNASQTDWPM